MTTRKVETTSRPFLAKWLLFVCLLQIIHGSASEYYSSIVGLESLLHTEQVLLNDLKDYVDMVKQTIGLLEKDIVAIEQEHNLAAADKENYLSNPVNAYKLITRLYADWERYRDYIAKGNEFLQQIDAHKNQMEHPTYDDFVESALALVRLQKTYNLDVAQVASGVLNGVKYGTSMSWSDCLILGTQSIKLKAYNQTKIWIKESARRFSHTAKQFNDYAVDTGLLEMLGHNLLKIGDNQMALKIFQLILQKNPQRLESLSQLYKNTEMLPDDYEETRTYHASNEFKLYEQVCRGEVAQSPGEQRHLKCRYAYADQCAFCRLAPFKVEQLNHDPEVMMFHDIVRTPAMEQIKEMALPLMGRSMVQAVEGGTKRSYRICKNAWLNYEAHPYALQMLRDLQDVTGLQMGYSEPLQVANYGLGGHYEPHFDFFLKPLPGDNSRRLSTSIFYLSDVEQGGATAFPFLKLAVKPIKGSVLFWYNLHRSLDGDYRTKHAGCPVIKGSKWIANVWTRDTHQDLSRPCALHRDHESSLPYEFIN